MADFSQALIILIALLCGLASRRVGLPALIGYLAAGFALHEIGITAGASTADWVIKEVYDIISSKYKLGRVRILLKEPRSTLSWHRDPEPRLHIPIITNPGCRMVIDNVAQHLPADGTVTITNNTKYHNFFNGGEQERIHLVACVLDNPFKNHGN